MDAAPLSERLPWLVVMVCWAAFLGVWLVGAIYNARRAPAARERAGRGPFWLVLALGYLLLRWVIPERAWEPLTVDAAWLPWAGVAVLLAATAFTFWARAALGIMWTSAAVVKEGHQLRTDGPYRITRHPIYTGMLGMVAGVAMVGGLGRWLAVLVFVWALLLLKIRAEERLLEGALGDAYRDYRRRVPGLVPLPRRSAGA